MSGTLQDLLAQAAGLLRMVERALQSDARGVEHPWFKVSYYREYFERYAELAESLRTKHPRFAKLPERGVPAGSPEDTAGGEPLFGRGEMEKLRGDLEFVLTAASSLDNVARRETPLSNTAIPSAQVGTATSGLVFISWSGPSSEQVASALRDWLPTVLRGLEVWLSSKDIAKGARWGPAISQKLDQTSFGIACVVPGNEKAPWLLFEAGAASKSVEEGRLSPFLFGVSPEELPPALAPLSHR